MSNHIGIMEEIGKGFSALVKELKEIRRVLSISKHPLLQKCECNKDFCECDINGFDASFVNQENSEPKNIEYRYSFRNHDSLVDAIEFLKRK